MAIILTDQELINAKRDIDDIGKAVNKKEVVHPRYGDSFKSLPMIIDEFQISSDAAEAAAITAVESANIAQSSSQIAQDSAALAELAATAATIGAGVFDTPEAGVDPVTGVADDAYFNVRSSSDESYVDEYRNVGGVAVATGKSYPSSLVVDILAEKTGKVDAKLKRENVSVWDFFTPEEYVTYKSAPKEFDAHRPVQEFFDYVRLNDVGTAYASGNFSVSSSVKMGLLGDSATKRYDGYLTITAIAPIDTIVDFQLSKIVWSGGVAAIGQGGGNWSSRTCRIGIALGNNADRLNIDWLEARYAYETGVKLYDKTTLSKIGTIRSTDNGSGFYAAGSVNYSLTANFTSSTRTGSANTVAQRNLLTVDVLPPADLSTPAYVVINDELYYIYSVDRETSTLTVYPWLKDTNQSGSLRYMFGGGVDVGGGDSSVVSIGSIDLMRNGIAYIARALYPPTATVVTTQFNGLAVMIGSRPDSASVGGVIEELYTEGNNFDIAVVTLGAVGFDIQNTVALNSAKFKYIVARGNDGVITPAWSGFFGVTINGNTRIKSPLNHVASRTSVRLGTKDRLFSFRANNLAVNLGIDALSNAAFGYDDAIINIVGNNTNGIPTQVTFDPPDGYTVNGQPSQVFENFIGAVQFFVLCDFSRNNFIVSQVGKASGTQVAVTYDPPSIAAGEAAETTVTLAGAAVGDIVQAAFSRYNAGIEISAAVSAANTVTVKFKNTSAAPIDLVSGTLKVKTI